VAATRRLNEHGPSLSRVGSSSGQVRQAYHLRKHTGMHAAGRPQWSTVGQCLTWSSVLVGVPSSRYFTLSDHLW
jgi:hypothetical protein